MNLETCIPAMLWEAVRINYEKRNFTGAILDAFYFLSELLRNKSGLEGDGHMLVGQAFGSAAPKIRINRLQTESDWNEQRGIEHLLRGLYQGFRNPRSHEKITDNEGDAKTIIMFIGYLVTKIDQARAQFSRPDFILRVLDPDFVPQERYAELLVADIPQRARLDVFLDLYRESERWKPEHIRIFLKALLAKLNDDEARQICEVITEDLKTSDDESIIRAIIGAFPSSLWPRVGEVARLRIDNKLIRSVQEGKYDSNANRCRSGALGTWSSNIFAVMTFKKQMTEIIASKIKSSSAERSYVFRYLFSSAHELSETIPESISAALCRCLKQGDEPTRIQLEFDPPWNENTWPNDLIMAFKNFQAAEPTISFDDDIPF